jgi:hypothetical protein
MSFAPQQNPENHGRKRAAAVANSISVNPSQNTAIKQVNSWSLPQALVFKLNAPRHLEKGILT